MHTNGDAQCAAADKETKNPALPPTQNAATNNPDHRYQLELCAIWCTTLIENGGPGWLHLVVLVCIWNALKMLAIGPVSLVLLVRTRVREHHARRHISHETRDEVQLPELTRSDQ